MLKVIQLVGLKVAWRKGYANNIKRLVLALGSGATHEFIQLDHSNQSRHDHANFCMLGDLLDISVDDRQPIYSLQ